MRDLVLTGGRIIDPANGRDEMADIAFGHGIVTEIGGDLPAGGAETVDVRGLLVVPGLIDLHTHVSLTNVVVPLRRATSAASTPSDVPPQ